MKQYRPHPKGAPPPAGSGFSIMANEKISKGLLLYFSSFDCIEKLDDAELGRFIKREMKWLMGKTNEPEYNELGSFFLHSRIKEQIELRGYNAQRKREWREKKAEEPQVSTYSQPDIPTEKEQQQITEFNDIEDVIDYLRNVEEIKGKDGMIYALNELCNKYRFDYMSVYDRYYQKYS